MLAATQKCSVIGTIFIRENLIILQKVVHNYLLKQCEPKWNIKVECDCTYYSVITQPFGQRCYVWSRCNPVKNNKRTLKPFGHWTVNMGAFINVFMAKPTTDFSKDFVFHEALKEGTIGQKTVILETQANMSDHKWTDYKFHMNMDVSGPWRPKCALSLLLTLSVSRKNVKKSYANNQFQKIFLGKRPTKFVEIWKPPWFPIGQPLPVPDHIVILDSQTKPIWNFFAKDPSKLLICESRPSK